MKQEKNCIGSSTGCGKIRNPVTGSGQLLDGVQIVSRQIRKIIMAAVGLAVLTMQLTACGKNSAQTYVAPVASPETTQEPDAAAQISMSYNMTMKAVVIKIDTVAGVVRMQNTKGGMNYTLTVNKGTVVLDKYGKARPLDEVQPGDVAEAYVNDVDGILAGLRYSSDNWEFEGSGNWKFNTEKNELNIGKEKYYYSDNLVLLSEGEEITVMDLHEQDILNIQGCGKKVLSVTLEQGHGYVRLTGVDDFIGGWVEIGKVIKPVSKDMLIAVPEGIWDVKVAKDGYGGSIGTTVVRNEECTVDFTEVAGRIVRYGTVEFTIEPADARLYIAGREMDYDNQILLEYDTYKIRVSADGYQDYTGDLRVEKALTNRKITLEKESGTETSASAVVAVSPSPVPVNTVAPASAPPEPSASAASDISANIVAGYKINIESPTGVNVYFDDAYVGISPVSFAKVSGSHTITFSREGYVTKSYTVEIGSEEKDVSFTLPDLEHQK